MFIGICGSICAGKSTIAQYLVSHHGFAHLYIKDDSSLTQGGSSEEKSLAVNGKSDGAANGGDPLEGLHRLRLTMGSRLSRQQQQQRQRQEHVFSMADDLLDFVTKRWRERWVTTDIPNEAVLDMYTRRPFFLLVSVDAPLTVRLQRFRDRGSGSEQQQQSVGIEQFVELSDTHLYDPVSGQLPLMSRATVRFLNTSSDLAHLYATLGKLDLLNPDRLRPSWDSYFMALASLAAQRSNCMKRRVGCVVVRDKRVISTGYNGTPRGLQNCGEGGCGRCNDAQGSGQGLATCLCLHAEENALLEAGRDRVRDGAVLYCDTCPCLTCSIKIVQVGINEVVYSHSYSMDGQTAAVFREAGVRLRQLVPPAHGLIHLEKSEMYK
ncbi:cytidine deaminase-like protein [Podospora didyma]|uniref:Deoxycytidylate deaminase n=1 Tax=Podospora didyma TaxID=330526 RepID=A0AAE0KKE5_9PEZI|nr:cytidine deaminase-like protein [Podospora didyma]